MNIQTTKDLITITRIVDGVTNRAEILTHLYDIDGNESFEITCAVGTGFESARHP